FVSRNVTQFSSIRFEDFGRNLIIHLLHILSNLESLIWQLVDNAKRQLPLSQGKETMGTVLKSLQFRNRTTPHVGVKTGCVITKISLPGTYPYLTNRKRIQQRFIRTHVTSPLSWHFETSETQYNHRPDHYSGPSRWIPLSNAWIDNFRREV
ncbi:unnamed protein product, partial [Hymenolepis diminuta]